MPSLPETTHNRLAPAVLLSAQRRIRRASPTAFWLVGSASPTPSTALRAGSCRKERGKNGAPARGKAGPSTSLGMTGVSHGKRTPRRAGAGCREAWGPLRLSWENSLRRQSKLQANVGLYGCAPSVRFTPRKVREASHGAPRSFVRTRTVLSQDDNCGGLGSRRGRADSSSSPSTSLRVLVGMTRGLEWWRAGGDRGSSRREAGPSTSLALASLRSG